MAAFSVETTITDNKGKTVSPLKALTRDKVGLVNFKEFADDFKQGLIGIARDTLREEQSGGFDKKPRTRIDGKFDRDPATVLPFGRLEFFARVSSIEAITEVWDLIQKRIIVDTGEMKNSNVVMVNDLVIARTRGELVSYLRKNSQKLGDGTKVTFLNTAPYARKLERLGYRAGKRGLRGSTRKSRKTKSRITGNLISAPNGAYYLSYKRIRSNPKTKGIANFFRFQYITGGNLGNAIPSDGRRRTYSHQFNSEAAQAGLIYIRPLFLNYHKRA